MPYPQHIDSFHRCNSLYIVKTALRFAGPGYTKDQAIDIDQKEHTFYASLPAKPDFVSFDPDYAVLKTVDFDKPKDMLKAQLEKDTSVAGRFEALWIYLVAPPLGALVAAEIGRDGGPAGDGARGGG